MLRRSLPPAGPRALLAPASAGAALLLASAWLADPVIGYVAAGILATVVGAVTLRWAPRSLRRPLILTLAALAAFGVVAARAEFRLTRFTHAPAEEGARQAAAQRSLLRAAVDEELTTLRRAAARSLVVPDDPVAAVATLNRAIGDGQHRAVLLLHGDTLVSWAGTLHADPHALTGASGVVATPFGLTLYAARDSGSRRAVAASLLYAAPPADRLVKGLTQRLEESDITEGFSFAPATESLTADALRYSDAGRPLFVARALLPAAEEVRFRLLERARGRAAIALLIAMLGFLVAVARRDVGFVPPTMGVLVVLRCIQVVPLSEFSTRSRLFDAGVFFYQTGRAFTANAGALALTAGVLLLAVMLVVRRVGNRLPRTAAIVLAIVAIGSGPFVIGALSRGITPPAEGASAALWFIWSLPLCLSSTVLLVLAGWAGRLALGGRRGLPIAVGPAVAMVAALVAPLAWQAPGQWPQWYNWLWIVAVGSLVLARPSRRAIVMSAMLAGLAAATVVWARTSRGRVELAERDVRGLDAPDAYAVTLASRLARSVQGEELPRTTQALLERYVASDLAASGYPVALSSWTHGALLATFGSAPFDVAFDTVGIAAQLAERTGQRVSLTTRASVYGVRVVAVPMRDGALAIMVAPRTRLIGSDAYARWYGLAPSAANEAPYSVQVIADTLAPRDSIRWRREGSELHGDWPVAGPLGIERAHMEVDLRGLDSLVPRGGLLVLADMAVVWLVWVMGAVADGRAVRWLRLRRRRMRSYRTRLSLGLFLFFLVPAAAFALWSWRQLSDDAQTSRRLLVTETMRAVAGGTDPSWLQGESRRLDTKLLLYSSGVLTDASDSLFADMAPMGRLLRPEVALELGVAEEVSATMPEPLAGATGMMGYRVLPSALGRNLVIAAPARVDDVLLDRRRRDLGVLVLFATAIGALAALWLSALAARQLARPIAELRGAARAVARGESELPLSGGEVNEFQPVFSAFRAMAADLGASRAALEEAQRRTDAVLRTVASGVVAVDERDRVILANPTADAMLGNVPAAGESLEQLDCPMVIQRVRAFLAGTSREDGFDLDLNGRTLRGQLTRLQRGGAVLTLDDVTELARAQRVLAWGEMARQVAHEIKNPLTPIRLGVQHLRRALGRPDFDRILDQNVTRILGEIDRLDEIARAFSRYGGAPEERLPPEPIDVTHVVRDTVALETLGESGMAWRLELADGLPLALARSDELREVLLNLFENARLAEARTVTTTVSRGTLSSGDEAVVIEVRDDGTGIAPEVLPRIFEPHFSTRTSGSGLGLAITRRMIEGWGGEVGIESAGGTVVSVRLKTVGQSDSRTVGQEEH